MRLQPTPRIPGSGVRRGAAALLGVASLALGGCPEPGTGERLGKQVDEAIEGARDGAIDALDRTSEGIDAAVDETRKALEGERD